MKPGYANFAIADPPLKLVLFEGPEGATINHLGVEVESAEEVVSAERRLTGAGLETTGVDETICCFAEKAETLGRRSRRRALGVIRQVGGCRADPQHHRPQPSRVTPGRKPRRARVAPDPLIATGNQCPQFSPWACNDSSLSGSLAKQMSRSRTGANNEVHALAPDAGHGGLSWCNSDHLDPDSGHCQTDFSASTKSNSGTGSCRNCRMTSINLTASVLVAADP